jgi:hypothetical protein
MKARKITLLLVLLALPAMAEPLTFSTVGCGPYNAKAAEVLPKFVQAESAAGKSEFIVHLGDIVTGADAGAGKVTAKDYDYIRKTMTEDSKLPAYIVPGDNEWNDMPDPDAAWKMWSKHLLNLDRLSRTPWKTINQVERPENFAFVHKGVLIIGINLVGGKVHDAAEWKTRFAQNLQWIGSLFETQKEKVRAAVILCQANPIGFGKDVTKVSKNFGSFVDPFGKLGITFEKPILFLHADGHKWLKDKPWPTAKNITRVQVDLIDPKFPPLRVTVLDPPEQDEMFNFDRQLKK